MTHQEQFIPRLRDSTPLLYILSNPHKNMTNLTADERLALITENLQEVLNKDIIETILAEGRSPKIYWGT